MSLQSYIFGQGTPDTYESLQSKRKTAERFGQMAMRTPQNLGEGLSSLGQAIAYRRLMSQANEGDAKGRDEFNSVFQRLLGGGMGGDMAVSSMSSAPSAPIAQAPITENPAGLDPSIIAAVDRVDPQGQFGSVEAKYNLPSGYLDRTYQIESGGNPNAQNPNSSAGGGFQFIDSTARQYGLTNKNDLGASADAAARLAADNREVLVRTLGREPTAAELYLAHQQGAGGAAKLLSNPNAPAASLVGQDAVRLNGGDASMTAQQFAGKWLGKFDNGGNVTMSAQNAQGTAPMGPQGGMGGINPAMIEALSNPYATEGQKMVLGALLQQQLAGMAPKSEMEMIALEQARLNLEQDRNGAGDGLPSEAQALAWRAEQAGLQPGTPEYQSFILNGGGDPATYRALEMQAINSGFEKGTPEFQQFMASRGAGQQSMARVTGENMADMATGGEAARAVAAGGAQGKIEAEAAAAASTQMANADTALQGIEDIRKSPYLGRGTGASSVFNAIPGTGGYGFSSRVEQLKGGAFLTAIQQLQGMGALSNSEGQTATAAIARLDTAQSEEDFVKALDDYEAIVRRGRDRAASKIPGSPEAGKPAAGQPQAATHRFNPATGQIEAIQ